MRYDVRLFTRSYRLLGKYFQLNDLDAEKYWFMFGLEPDMDISKNKFI